VDIRRLKELASRLISEGRFERAEVLYRQMLTLQPRDANLWLRHAELLKRLERTAPSVTSYRMAAQLLMEAGHTHRAVACLKLALALQPDDVDLVTDIIRYELRQRQTERSARPPPPIVEQQLTAPLPDTETPALLALPMFASTDSRIAATVPDVQDEVPAPKASAPRIPLEVESPLQRWPQVRRLGDGEVAIKASPFSKWIVLTADAQLEVRFFDDYPVPETALWLEEPTGG
jgi:tetratricopeptide (TPR) repeat protein